MRFNKVSTLIVLKRDANEANFFFTVVLKPPKLFILLLFRITAHPTVWSVIFTHLTYINVPYSATIEKNQPRLWLHVVWEHTVTHCVLFCCSKSKGRKTSKKTTTGYHCTALQKFGELQVQLIFYGKDKLSLQSAGLMPGCALFTLL